MDICFYFSWINAQGQNGLTFLFHKTWLSVIVFQSASEKANLWAVHLVLFCLLLLCILICILSYSFLYWNLIVCYKFHVKLHS